MAGYIANTWGVPTISGSVTYSTAAVAPVNTVAPVVAGTPVTGNTLTCSTGTWTGTPTPTYSYQWQHGTTNISGATSSTYSLSSYVGETIRCVVTATNAAGTVSANSNSTAAVTAPDVTAPTNPSSLSASAVSSSQINLSWTASTDAVGVTGYKVYRGGSLIANLGNVTTYSNTGLTASTSYSYYVTAGDAAGNWSGQSNTVSATTYSVAPVFTGVQIRVGSNTGSTSNFSLNESSGTATLYAVDAWSDGTYVVSTGVTWSVSPGGYSSFSSQSANHVVITAGSVSSNVVCTVTATAANGADTISVTIINYVAPPDDPVAWVTTSISGTYYQFSSTSYAVNPGSSVTLTGYASGTNMNRTINWTGPSIGSTSTTPGSYSGYVSNQLMGSWTFTPTYTGGLGSGHYSVIVSGTGANSPAYGTMNMNVRIPFPTTYVATYLGTSTAYIYSEEPSWGNWAIGSSYLNFGFTPNTADVSFTIGTGNAPAGFHWGRNDTTLQLIKDAHTPIPVGVNVYNVPFTAVVPAHHSTYIPGTYNCTLQVTIDSVAMKYISKTTPPGAMISLPSNGSTGSFVLDTDGWQIRYVYNGGATWRNNGVSYSPNIASNSNAVTNQVSPTITCTRTSAVYTPGSHTFTASITDGIHHLVNSGLEGSTTSVLVTFDI